MGCDADLPAGAVIVVPGNGTRMVVIAEASVEQARASSEALGAPLVVVPGERFYEVEVGVVLAPAGNN